VKASVQAAFGGKEKRKRLGHSPYYLSLGQGAVKGRPPNTV